MTKELKSQIRRDRRQRLLDMVSKDLDVRDRWMGIRYLKKGFHVMPYTLKDDRGKRTQTGNKATEAATFLATAIWGKTEEQRNNEEQLIEEKIVTEELNIQTNEIELKELIQIIRRLKQGKTPGPDGVPIEFLKELHGDILEEIRTLMNEWWNKEEMPEEITNARVVLIFKKGDKENLANYRPISLLNSFYKLMAAIVQMRIECKIDKHLQGTQYGFRKRLSTADATHYIRRMIDKGESRKSKTLLLLLDWEKAFDKVIHHRLIGALKRMNIPEKIINIITMFYKQPKFCVEMDGNKSEYQPQETGIRQGCPLSPYLFIILMTVMFHDMHKGDAVDTINKE